MRKLTFALSVALLATVLVPAAVSAAWPVASRSSYVSTWYSSGHPAIDIAAPQGTRVVPIGNGTVVFAGWKSNCGGYQVWVRNHDVYSAYYHEPHQRARRPGRHRPDDHPGARRPDRLRDRAAHPRRGLDARSVGVRLPPGQSLALHRQGLLRAASVHVRST